MWGIKGFIGIGEYKNGYLVKIKFNLFIGKMYWERIQQKDFGRYLSISSEIKCIL